MILLASGLSLARDNSFARQLRLLAGGLAALGAPCALAGTGPALRLGPAEADVPRIDAAAAREAAGCDPQAVVLLGYPDQFPIVGEPGPPAYLWAQASRPMARGSLGRAVAVPLTERTRAFLKAAGCCLGPTIPHCVDTALFRPPLPEERRQARRELGVGDDALVVGTVGANTARKRFDRLMEAFVRIGGGSAVLVVKTDRASAPGGFDLPALAGSRGLSGRVRVLTEALPAATLARLYWALDVYAHAAEWEGFCVPVVEAMACGVPVAAADTQGPGEILPYREGLVGEGEWLDEEGGSRLLHVDPSALARAVNRLAADQELRERAAALGRERAAADCDAGVVAGRWLALLRRGV